MIRMQALVGGLCELRCLTSALALLTPSALYHAASLSQRGTARLHAPGGQGSRGCTVSSSSGGSTQQLTNLRHFRNASASLQYQEWSSKGIVEQLRQFHTTEAARRAAALGIVDQLHEESAIQLPVAGARNLWEVGWAGLP